MFDSKLLNLSERFGEESMLEPEPQVLQVVEQLL
jgi:hypothetical protein